MPESGTPDSTADAALALDTLLLEGARGPRARLLPAGPAARLALAAARHPTVAAGRVVGLLAELGRIGMGAARGGGDQRGPDPRHSDPVWVDDPLLSRLLRVHRASRAAALELVDDLAPDRADADRLRFAVGRLADLTAPGGNPFLHPGGRTVGTVRALLDDLRARPRLPGGRERSVPGVETATAPGAVVLRTRDFELIHYLPSTEHVGEVPVLVVPPFANSFALVDLAPHHSLVRELVAAGRQVLTLSWHADRDGGLDTHAAALVEALDAVKRISRHDRTVLFGVAGGGLLAAVTTAVLERPERVAGLVLAGTVLEGGWGRTGPDAGLPVDDASVRAAVAAVERAGRLDGRTLAEVHALLDPDALVWPAWERRYREADTSPDPLRAWNLAARDLPAALYRDLVEAALTGALTRPGGLSVLGRPVDLAAVAQDLYVVAGVTDRVGCWQSAYRTTQLLGGKSRFVLVTGSTAAAVGYGGVGLRAADGPVSAGSPADPERWRAHAHQEHRSWWSDLADWLTERGGDTVDAPPELGGGRGLHPVDPAPGRYL